MDFHFTNKCKYMQQKCLLNSLQSDTFSIIEPVLKAFCFFEWKLVTVYVSFMICANYYHIWVNAIVCVLVGKMWLWNLSVE